MPIVLRYTFDSSTAMLNLVGISERRACQLVEILRVVLQYVSKVQSESERLQDRMVELVSERRRTIPQPTSNGLALGRPDEDRPATAPV